MTQLKRGRPGQDVFITNLKQNLPRHSDWQALSGEACNRTRTCPHMRKSV